MCVRMAPGHGARWLAGDAHACVHACMETSVCWLPFASFPLLPSFSQLPLLLPCLPPFPGFLGAFPTLTWPITTSRSSNLMHAGHPLHACRAGHAGRWPCGPYGPCMPMHGMRAMRAMPPPTHLNPAFPEPPHTGQSRVRELCRLPAPWISRLPRRPSYLHPVRLPCQSPQPHVPPSVSHQLLLLAAGGMAPGGVAAGGVAAVTRPTNQMPCVKGPN
jgi:hypothetical protein